MRRLSVLFFFLCLCSFPSKGFAASLFLNPASGTYAVGDFIRVTVLVSSEGSSLNVVSGTLTFPPGFFSVQSVSKAGSILNFWATEPVISNSAGSVQFEGVSLSGFQGSSGTVLTVVLRALKPGSGALSFQAGQVLANDGQGTDITSTVSGGAFQIEAAKASATPVQKEEKVLIEPMPQSPTPIILPPSISLGERDFQKVVLGTSDYGNATVLLTFVSASGSKIFITGSTDDDGSFALSVPQVLRSGPYAVSAVLVLEDGVQSNASNMLTVEVQYPLFMAENGAAYTGLFGGIAFLTLLGYAMSRRHFSRRKGSSTGLKKDIKKAEDAVHKSFVLLDQDLADHLKGKNSGRADTREREEIASLRKDLKDAENFINKEIKGIDYPYPDEKE